MRIKLGCLLVVIVCLTGMLLIAYKLQKAKATETIYIRPNGDVEGTDKIQRNGDSYIFIDNINDSIVIERDGIIIDGANYTLSGTGIGTGIGLTGRRNVTIKHVEISGFRYGIWSAYDSSIIEIYGNTIRNCSNAAVAFGGDANITIHENTIATNDGDGIHISSSDYIKIFENNITSNKDGIEAHICAYVNISRNIFLGNNESAIELMEYSEFNTIVQNLMTANHIGVMMYHTLNSSVNENNITGNQAGVLIWVSHNNTIHENTIRRNNYGIVLEGGSSDNIICYNSFIDNTYQAACEPGTGPNFLDDGLGRGNYWSDYLVRYPNASEIDDAGIWDTPYVIDENNQDNYPLIPEFPSFLIPLLFMTATFLLVAFLKKKRAFTPPHRTSP